MVSPDTLKARNADEQAVLNFFIFMMRRQVDDLVDLFLPDAVQEQPYVFPGQTPVLTGHEGIRANYEMALKHRHNHSFDIQALHRTEDPACFIVEVRGVSTLGENGHLYDNRYVAVFMIRARKIANLRFYFNPIVAQDAFAKIRGLA